MAREARWLNGYWTVATLDRCWTSQCAERTGAEPQNCGIDAIQSTRRCCQQRAICTARRPYCPRHEALPQPPIPGTAAVNPQAGNP